MAACYLDTGKLCVLAPFPDINECDTNNGGCAQTCTNNVGSYQCSCRTGYLLNSNGHTCDGMILLKCVLLLMSLTVTMTQLHFFSDYVINH